MNVVARRVYREPMTQEDAAATDGLHGRFDERVTEFMGRDGIMPPGATQGFGNSSLRVDGHIFAMLVRGRLVVKLPAARVSELEGLVAALQAQLGRDSSKSGKPPSSDSPFTKKPGRQVGTGRWSWIAKTG